MSRAAFIERLRQGLAGMPAATIDDIVADYQGHFAEGEAAGRSEAEVAAALGDPDRLARELKLEQGIKRWEAEKNPSAAIGAVIAVLGLGAIDIIILLPILMGVVGTLIGLYVAAVVLFFVGCGVLTAGPFFSPIGGPFVPVLGGLGLMASQVFVISILTLITIGLVNALIWYARLHYQLLKPAIEPGA
jgi:uncharacterized membrane protein